MQFLINYYIVNYFLCKYISLLQFWEFQMKRTCFLSLVNDIIRDIVTASLLMNVFRSCLLVNHSFFGLRGYEKIPTSKKDVNFSKYNRAKQVNVKQGLYSTKVLLRCS